MQSTHSTAQGMVCAMLARGKAQHMHTNQNDDECLYNGMAAVDFAVPALDEGALAEELANLLLTEEAAQ